MQALSKTKVVIFGHSWGSALGTLYAARFPQKVAAYVGSGQYGDGAVGEAASYAFALAEAQRRGKHRAVEKLRAIGPPPHTAKQLLTERNLVARLEGAMRPRDCGRWDEPYSPARNRRSSTCPAPCAASGSLLTRCGRRPRG